MTTIIGIALPNRTEDALNLQKILTDYGCHIRIRLGLHQNEDYKCSNAGIVIIEVTDKVNEIYDILAKNWQIQTMKF